MKVSTEEKNNLKILKSVLCLKPTDLLLNVNSLEKSNKLACFTQNYVKYGKLESWEHALSLMNTIPDEDKTFNEVILPDTIVKPYLDVEWFKDEFPNYTPDYILPKIVIALKNIFKKTWSITLTDDEIFLATCNRKIDDKYKFSYHVIVNTVDSYVFKNTNSASFLARELKTTLTTKFSIDDKIIDSGVYGRSQRLRLIGQSKKGLFCPFLPLDETKINDVSYYLNYVVTNVPYNHNILKTEEQADDLYKSLSPGVKILTDKQVEDVTHIVKSVVYPSAYLDRIDSAGILQFNYDHSKETACFLNNDVSHSKIGFFVYVKKQSIHIGCHSGNCIDNNTQKKIIKLIGTLQTPTDLTFEKVDKSNKFEHLDQYFVQECIKQEAYGMHLLFEQMYLTPKRIKWVDSGFGETYFWNGKLWEMDNYSFLSKLLVETVCRVLNYNINVCTRDCLDISSTDDLAYTINLARLIVRKLRNGQMIKVIFEFLKPNLKDDEFLKIKDIHPGFLSCKNGMVNLTNGTISLAVPDDNITKTLSVEYKPDIDCSIFDDFVKSITSDQNGPNPDMYNYIKWAIGYALQGNPNKKIFFIFYGEHGYNGKSLLLNTISDVLTYYAIEMDKSVILDGPKKSSGSHSTELCRLENCRIGILSDTSEDATIDDGQVKRITGSTDVLSVREIYGKQKEFLPRFVPFISTNHKININLSDKALYERVRLIPFYLSFVENPTESYERKGDFALPEKFKNSKEEVLKWLINASIFYNQNKNDIKIPQRVKEEKEKYRREMDNIRSFIDTTFICVDDDTKIITIGEVVNTYKIYCQNNKIKFVAKKAEKEFDKVLKTCIHNRVKYYSGIIYKDRISDDDIFE